jgi:hypothetical protein
MSGDPRHGGGAFLAMVGAVGVTVLGGLLAATAILGPPVIPIWGAVSVFGWLTLRGPVGEAIGARLRGGVPAELPPVPDEVYTELDELRARMSEMEERQDFAERLLTRRSPGDEGGDHGGT